MSEFVLTPQQMRDAEDMSIAQGETIPSLMRRAGQALADHILTRVCAERPLVILVGPGNNGGDGLVAAEILRSAGRAVHVVLACKLDSMNMVTRALVKDLTVGMTPLSEFSQSAPQSLFVDALFGTGLDRPLSGMVAELIHKLNTQGASVISVDIPSGVHGESGAIMGVACQAQETVTFFCRKWGHVLFPGCHASGEVFVKDIGIDKGFLHQMGVRSYRNTPSVWEDSYPRFAKMGHKYDRGHVLVISGGVEMAGAARLAARAALRCGAGLVTLVSPSQALQVQAAHVTAVMVRMADTVEELVKLIEDSRVTGIVIGSGLGLDQRVKVEAVLRSRKQVVVDADGMSCFQDDWGGFMRLLAARRAPTVLTPHEGEFARVFPMIRASTKFRRAQEAAKISQSIVVLKGADSVIADPDGTTVVNTHAPPWLATAGSGDVLAGMIGGHLGQGMPPFAATCASVWLHSVAGQRCGPAMIAEDLDEGLREVAAELRTRLDL